MHVLILMPSAMSLLRRPRTTSIMVSRSRADSDSNARLAGAKRITGALPLITIASKAEVNSFQQFTGTERLYEEVNGTPLSSLGPTSEYLRVL